MSTTFSRRLACHLSSGARKDHLQLLRIKISRKFLNVKILGYFPNRNKLRIAEALLIEEKRPSIDIQHEGFARILKLFNLFNIIIPNGILYSNFVLQFEFLPVF